MNSSVRELLGFKVENKLQRLAGDLVRADRDLLAGLIKVRRHRKLRQVDVAELLGVNQSAVAGFERLGGDPRLSTIRRYALAVGARVEHRVIRADDWHVTMPSPPAVSPTEKDVPVSMSVSALWELALSQPGELSRA